MGNQPKDDDQPPTPGGDPDQLNDGLPGPPGVQETDEDISKDKSGYGHIGNKDVPRPKDAPPPHQIF